MWHSLQLAEPAYFLRSAAGGAGVRLDRCALDQKTRPDPIATATATLREANTILFAAGICSRKLAFVNVPNQRAGASRIWLIELAQERCRCFAGELSRMEIDAFGTQCVDERAAKSARRCGMDLAR